MLELWNESRSLVIDWAIGFGFTGVSEVFAAHCLVWLGQLWFSIYRALVILSRSNKSRFCLLYICVCVCLFRHMHHQVLPIPEKCKCMKITQDKTEKWLHPVIIIKTCSSVNTQIVKLLHGHGDRMGTLMMFLVMY